MNKILILYFLLWCGIVTTKFYTFGYYDWDLALYAQLMHQLVNGSLSPSLIGANFLVDHPHYIAFLLAPLYKIFQHPLTLLYLNCACFTIAAWLLYRIASIYLTSFTSKLITCIFLFSPINAFMLLYEFHFETLGLPLLMGMLLAFLTNRFWLFCLLAIVLMLCKENMVAIVFMFGCWGVCVKQGERFRWGLISGFALVFFYISLFVIIPHLRMTLPIKQHVYFHLYESLGETPIQWVISILQKPSIIIDAVTNFEGKLYLEKLFIPLAPLLLIKPWPILIVFPILGQHLLSGAISNKTIYFHYASIFMPFIMVSVILGLNFLQQQSKRLFYLLLVVCLIMVVLQIRRELPFLIYRFQHFYDAQDYYRKQLIDLIPPQASVVTSFEFLPHLTNHQKLYAFYNIWRDNNNFTGEKPFVIKEPPDFALINWKDNWLLQDQDYPDEVYLKRLELFFKQYHWRIKAQFGALILYERIK